MLRCSAWLLQPDRPCTGPQGRAALRCVVLRCALPKTTPKNGWWREQRGGVQCPWWCAVLWQLVEVACGDENTYCGVLSKLRLTCRAFRDLVDAETTLIQVSEGSTTVWGGGGDASCGGLLCVCVKGRGFARCCNAGEQSTLSPWWLGSSQVIDKPYWKQRVHRGLG